MVPENPQIPMTENFVLYILGLVAKQRGSHVFFKISNNMSLRRGWHYWCAPDLDLIEIRADDTIIAYEVKGQRKRKQEYEWPGVLEGLGQALIYLTLPRVTDVTVMQRTFEGGVPDLVYLVHPIAPGYVLAPSHHKVISLTPVGFVGIQPLSISQSMQSGEVGPAAIFAGQLDKVVEVVPAQKNPLQDPEAKTFFLENLASLKSFGEESRIFKRQIERAALEYLDILPKERLVIDQKAPTNIKGSC